MSGELNRGERERDLKSFRFVVFFSALTRDVLGEEKNRFFDLGPVRKISFKVLWQLKFRELQKV